MAAMWSPRDINRLIATTTGCMCLLILVGGTILGIYRGFISPQYLGSTKALGVGGGVVGLSSVLLLVIKTGLGGTRDAN